MHVGVAQLGNADEAACGHPPRPNEPCRRGPPSELRGPQRTTTLRARSPCPRLGRSAHPFPAQEVALTRTVMALRMGVRGACLRGPTLRPRARAGTCRGRRPAARGQTRSWHPRG
eukprot:scaffold2406_cov363-Prasinococcus_capsulatus_cf.AAC.3